MTRNEIVIAVIVYAVPCVVAAFLWARLQFAWQAMQTIRRVAEENSTYRPDDLIERPEGEIFERASRYWSGIILRVVPPTHGGTQKDQGTGIKE